MSSQYNAFEDELNEKGYARPKGPIWELNLDEGNEKDIVKWLQGELAYLTDANRLRFEEIKRNYALYKGVQYNIQDTREGAREKDEDRAKGVKRTVANHLFDLTAHRVSRLVKYKPAVSILPTNDEWEDKIAASWTDKLLKNIWYKERFEGTVILNFLRLMMVAGEAYLWIDWDPNKGDELEEYKQAKKRLGKIPLIGGNGEQVKDSAGRQVFVEKPVKTGDVKYEIISPLDIFLERREKLEDVDYCFRRKIMPTSLARVLYQDSADKIKTNQKTMVYDFETNELKPSFDSVEVWEFYHKPHPAMAEGRKIVMIGDAIVFNDVYPFDHNELPFERMTDIEMMGELNGVSFFRIVKPLTSAYNVLTNMILKNQTLVAHPKWMVPAGSVKLESLGNDITVVQFKGPVAPQLVQANPTPGEIFKHREDLKAEFQAFASYFPTSQGTPPSGVTANVALQFLDEKENERFNEQIIKLNEFIVKTAYKTLSVCGTYYDANDKRMVRVLGKDSEWQTDFFDASHLSTPYEVRIQNSSALPQSKAARIQTLIDLKSMFPTMVSDEQFLDLMDFAQTEKFIDIGTVSVRKAEAEFEMILSGKDVKAPEMYEDLVQKWKVFSKKIEEWSFKYKVPEDKKQLAIDYMNGLEFLMIQRMSKDQGFAAQVAGLSGFPKFFEVEGPIQQPAGAPTGPAPTNAQLPEAQAQPMPVNPGTQVAQASQATR